MGVFRARVTSTFAAGSGEGVNTWCVRTTGAFGDGTDVIAVMSYIETFYDSIKSKFPSSMKWTWDGSVAELGSETPEYAASSGGWTVTGTSGAPGYEPAAAMLCVSWKTSLATKRGRGRTFIGPIGQGQIDNDGSPTAVLLAQVQDAADALVTDSTAPEGLGAVAIWSQADSLARDIVAASVRDRYAVLRSRRD